MAHTTRAVSLSDMHLFLAAVAVLLFILGLSGFELGGLPTILFGFLAAAGLVGAWKARPESRGQREDCAMPQPAE